MGKEKILIVDDSEMNRSILADMLGDSYDIIEAEDGVQAVVILQKMHVSIDLVLLDVVMPQMDGFGVLEAMNHHHWIDDIPVIMVSAETEASQAERAYELGATDFIKRPFDSFIVLRRVENTLLLYAKQKQLIGMVEEQLYEKEKDSRTMIDILSHIVEVRNGESGLHVLHVRVITDFLLRKLKRRLDSNVLTDEYIKLVGNAAALHDIGKIAIDEKILNKPGRLTDEEFAIMKTHTLIGAGMLEGEFLQQDNPLVKIAYEICRWHHERYDGNGYPDGLKGDDIPISAQVVALADAYDALTSARAYKLPYDHDDAVRMILDGACGTFNPMLLDCLREHSADLRATLEKDVTEEMNRREIKGFTESVLSSKNRGVSERTLRLLDYERTKNAFFSTASEEEIQFEYAMSSHILTLSSWAAKKLGVNEIVMDAYHDKRIQEVVGGIDWGEITKFLHRATPNQSDLDFTCKINCDGEFRWHRVIIRAVWTPNDPPQCEGALGKAIDIHEARMEAEAMKKRASEDELTGLLNFTNSKMLIEERLANDPDLRCMMVMIDVDSFSAINDTYGQPFGNRLLRHVADVLNQELRNEDISSRIDGDKFLLFLACGSAHEQVIQRLFAALCTPYEDCPVSVSMGVARTVDVGTNYESVFRAAAQALRFAKENGRGRCCFYDTSMQSALPTPQIHTDSQGKRS